MIECFTKGECHQNHPCPFLPDTSFLCSTIHRLTIPRQPCPTQCHGCAVPLVLPPCVATGLCYSSTTLCYSVQKKSAPKTSVTFFVSTLPLVHPHSLILKTLLETVVSHPFSLSVSTWLQQKFPLPKPKTLPLFCTWLATARPSRVDVRVSPLGFLGALRLLLKDGLHRSLAIHMYPKNLVLSTYRDDGLAFVTSNSNQVSNTIFLILKFNCWVGHEDFLRGCGIVCEAAQAHDADIILIKPNRTKQWTPHHWARTAHHRRWALSTAPWLNVSHLPLPSHRLPCTPLLRPRSLAQKPTPAHRLGSPLHDGQERTLCRRSEVSSCSDSSCRQNSLSLPLHTRAGEVPWVSAFSCLRTNISFRWFSNFFLHAILWHYRPFSSFLLLKAPRLWSLIVCCNPLGSPLLFHVPSFPSAWFDVGDRTLTAVCVLHCRHLHDATILHLPPFPFEEFPVHSSHQPDVKHKRPHAGCAHEHSATQHLQKQSPTTTTTTLKSLQNDCDRLQSSAIGQPRINRTAPFSGAPCVRTRSSSRSFLCGQISWPSVMRRSFTTTVKPVTDLWSSTPACCTSPWQTRCFHPCCLHLDALCCSFQWFTIGTRSPLQPTHGKNCLLTLSMNKYLVTQIRKLSVAFSQR